MAGQKEKEKQSSVDSATQQAILVETILKEERYQKLFTNYSINPFKKMHRLTGKPNSLYDAADGDEDSNFRAAIARANEVPTHKFVCPQTEAHEIGWITQPLQMQRFPIGRFFSVANIDQDRSDERLHRPNRRCEITKYMELVWAAEAQIR